jgi:aspartate racemase
MKTEHLKLGIIGGAGPLASALLYRSILEKYYTNSIFDIPIIIVVNFPFTRGLTREESSEHEDLLKEEVQMCVNTLSTCGVAIAGLACNTLHLFLDQVDLKGIRFLHMPKEVIKQIKQCGMHRILILGSQTTIARRLYHQSQFETIAPNENEQVLVDDIIDKIIQGKIDQHDAEILSNLIFQIHKRENLEGVVLGCTELPVLHHKYPIQCKPLLIFDSIQILANLFFWNHINLSRIRSTQVAT